MKVVFFGTPHFVVPVLKTLIDHFEVVAVVTSPDKPAGRHNTLTPAPVAQYAQKHNIPIFKPEKPYELAQNSEFLMLNSELIVTAAYGKILTQELLEIPKVDSINVHPSLLPKYRGPTPIQNAILNGDSETGFTLYRMDTKMDHGPILYQEKVLISQTDTLDLLSKKLFQKSAAALPEVIQKYTHQQIQPIPQDDSQATYCGLIKKENGYIDLITPPTPLQFDRMVRAYYPWPGAWTHFRIRNKELRIRFLPDKKIQVEGEKPMEIKEFINGYPETKIWIEKLYVNLKVNSNI